MLSVINQSYNYVDLDKLYSDACNNVTDINEHIPVHRQLALECSSVVEIGVRSMISTFGLLKGLSESGNENLKYTGIDLDMPPSETFNKSKQVCKQNNIEFNFIARDDMTIPVEEVGECDMLFIDSLHTYAHLSYEVETFSVLAKKYITFHDSSPPWESVDDHFYHGDRSEYPEWIDREKRGVWPAIEDFLVRHPEWVLKERKTNNHGFTILEKAKV